MLYPSLLLAALLLIVEVWGKEYFLIRHKMSGKCVATQRYDDDPHPQYHLIVHTRDQSYSDMKFSFESVDGQWGYIRNYSFNDHIACPATNDMYPSGNTMIVIQSDAEHPYSRFALDQVNNRIIHHGGNYWHVVNNEYEPADRTYIYLQHSVNEVMEFELVNPDNLDEIVYPYGDAEIIGDWHVIFSVAALATHEYTYTVTLGKSETESITDSFQFVWEGSAGVQAWFAQMSSSTSLTDAIETSSSSTWTAEVTETHKITVEGGTSVATWQMHFTGEQLGHKAVHHSNLYYDTEGPNVKPPSNARYYSM